MQNQMRPHGQNPYALPTKIASGVLASIATFFVFPFLFLSVGAVSAFSAEKYPWLPLGLVALIWGALLAAAFFALAMLLLVLAINAALQAIGNITG